MKTRRLFLAASVLFFVAGGTAAQEERVVRGTVVDSVTKQPVSGAMVTVEGTNLTAVTGNDGTFSLPAPVRGDVVLRVENPGYTRAEVRLSAAAQDAGAISPRP